MKTNPFLLTDFYKVGHIFQYPPNTTLVYSNLTPRKSRISGVDDVVFFGLQYFMQEYMIKYFNENFFDLPLEDVLNQYKRVIKFSLGSDLPSYKHLEDLHKLGYLPLEIKALPEGTVSPIKVPVLTIKNTLPEFYWLTNFIESLMSASLWQSCTSATIAREYKRILSKYAEETGIPKEFVQWQGHDFSFRGMSSLESAILSGMGHLTSFSGTDTIPAICALEQYYDANIEQELVGGSVPATEHSVMCAGGSEKDNELNTFKRLITEVYPNGIVSIVSDTWNLWDVLCKHLPALHSEIMARDGKVVIRPDSGDPVDIICGHKEFTIVNGEYFTLDNRFMPDTKITDPYAIAACKGVIEILWEIFGGTTTDKGYKLLDSHIGAIYGDSITPEVAEEMCKRLKDKGFASQMVLGIGSFTYQYNTRDTQGWAMKATYVEIDGVGIPIFKKPFTDDGTKNSAKGLLRVYRGIFGIDLVDECTWEIEARGELKTVFKDGVITKHQKLSEIRKRIASSI